MKKLIAISTIEQIISKHMPKNSDPLSIAVAMIKTDQREGKRSLAQFVNREWYIPLQKAGSLPKIILNIHNPGDVSLSSLQTQIETTLWKDLRRNPKLREGLLSSMAGYLGHLHLTRRSNKFEYVGAAFLAVFGEKSKFDQTIRKDTYATSLLNPSV